MLHKILISKKTAIIIIAYLVLIYGFVVGVAVSGVTTVTLATESLEDSEVVSLLELTILSGFSLSGWLLLQAVKEIKVTAATRNKFNFFILMMG